MKKKTFFIVFEGLSFGEKWKIDKKIADTSFSICLCKKKCQCNWILKKVFYMIFKLDIMMQIMYYIVYRCLYSLFTLLPFWLSLISVSKKWDIERIYTHPFTYKWQKFNRMNENRSGVSEYWPWIFGWVN